MFRYLIYILFLVAFGLLACRQEVPAPVHTPERIDPKTNMPYTYSYLALGDSYTIGESVPEADRWGVRLAELLRNAGVSVGDPVTIARTGWTTSELIGAIEDAKLKQSFDLVSLLIGVNNQYRGQSLEVYRQEFRQLLQIAIGFTRNEARRVIVLSIPDWGVTPFAQGRDRQRIAAEIDAFNTVAREECQRAGIAFIDITPVSRSLGTDLTYLANDRLHYSGKMHQEWAKLAFPAAQQILK